MFIGLFMACAAWCLAPAVAEGAPKQAVQLAIGKADTFDLPGNVADILVADPAVADVGVLRSSRLYIVGRGVGDTNILAFDETGELLAEIGVHVHIDEATMQRTIKEFFPDEDVSVKTVNGDIVLTGRVSTPAAANQVRDLAGRFVPEEGQTIVDLMNVKGEQQVMLKVRVLEANRNVLRELGVETDYGTNNSSGFDFDTGSAVGLTAVPFGIGQLFLDRWNDIGPVDFTLRALEQDGLINTLAEPNLTAISGEAAGFLAGGEFPVPAGRDDDGNVILEYREFGVSLNFRPVVMSKDRISLQLSTEVSTLSEQDGIVLQNLTIPGLQVRRADTTVEMASGGRLMIAGLLQSNSTDALNGLPGLKDLPVLGELFKSKSFERNESELVIMVTAYLVEPYKEAEAKKVREKKNVSALSKSFVRGLKENYGGKVPTDIESGPAFGFVVD